MLVLSRRERERIRVGKDIVVTVVRLAGDKVRLGIEAPADLVVLRDELKPHDAMGPSPAAVINGAARRSVAAGLLACKNPH